jgi:hypothetical protein
MLLTKGQDTMQDGDVNKNILLLTKTPFSSLLDMQTRY